MNQQEKQIIKKRIQTTMIGALYEFEENFGYLWGLDKEGELTEKEKRFLDQWEDTRNRILNKGNSQLRQCLGELEKSQGQMRYNYKFKKGQDRNEN